MQCIQTPNCLPRVLYPTSLKSASIFSHSKQKKGKAREFMTPAPESCSFNPSYVLSVVADLCCNNFYPVVRTDHHLRSFIPGEVPLIDFGADQISAVVSFPQETTLHQWPYNLPRHTLHLLESPLEFLETLSGVNLASQLQEFLTLVME